jgi:hypothetical protein
VGVAGDHEVELGVESGDDGGLPVMGWWNAGITDDLFLAVFPVVVRDDQRAVAIAQFLLASLDLHAPLVRIMLPLVLWGIGWSLFNAPNQRSILSAVATDKIGAAAGMIATSARTGGAMGVALSATLFGYLLAGAGLTANQVNSPNSWRAAPEVFMSSFSMTIYALSIFTLFAVFSSAVRGSKLEQ